MPLNKKQEKELIKRISAGDKIAKAELIQANKFLIKNIAKKYIGNNKKITMAKLENLGNKGLLKAIEKYDPNKDYKFSTYATWWIRQAIRNSLGIEKVN